MPAVQSYGTFTVVLLGIQEDPLSIVVEPPAETDAPLVVRWLGRASHEKPSQTLSRFLKELLVAAMSRGCPIDMHFEELEYINSSTIVVLLLFMKDVQRDELHLRLFYNPEAAFQRTVIQAFGHFKGDRVKFIEAP